MSCELLAAMGAAEEALAFVLSAKLGSLEDAFQYMDTVSSGNSFALVSWHTGLLVLRIDTWISPAIMSHHLFHVS